MKGWRYESYRHSLAAKGIKTSQPKLAKVLRSENVIFEPKYDGCLFGDVLVDTEVGRLRIKRIVSEKLKVKVKSYNFLSKKVEYKSINNYFKNGKANDFLTIVAANSGKMKVLQATKNHEVFVPGKKKLLENLKVNDEVFVIGPALTSFQNQMILGSLLGDSCLMREKRGFGRHVRFETSHSIKQKEYLMFKYDLIKNLSPGISTRKSGFGSEMIALHSSPSPSLMQFYDLCYLDDKKKVSEKWLNQLSYIGIAFWFMDDGCITISSKQKPRMHLHTDGFSLEEVNLIKKFFNKKGFGCSIIHNSKQGWFLTFNIFSTVRLSQRIAPFIHPSLAYKVIEEKVGTKINKNILDYETIYPVKILKKQRMNLFKAKNRSKFDIEVADNHNYFAGGILVSNSRMILEKKGSELTFTNRRGVVKNDTYPELYDINKSIKGDVILDGEVVVLDKQHPFGNFEKLAMRDRLKDKEEIKKRSKTLPLTYVVFDILEKDRQKVADLPLSERKKILDNVIAQGKNIREIEFSNKSSEMLSKVKQVKGEGIVQKDINSKYAPGSTRSWEKYKLLKTNDVVAIGYVGGKGKRKGTFGALKIFVKTPEGYKSVGKVGAGFSDKDLIDIKKRLDCGEKIVGRVKYRSVGSRGNYIEPRWIDERQDILPEQTHG